MAFIPGLASLPRGRCAPTSDAETVAVSFPDPHGPALTPIDIDISNSHLKGNPDAPVTIVEFSDFQSCLDSGRGEQVVREDIREGTAAGVNSTPTLFVNGRVLRGVYRPSVLEQIIQHTLDMPVESETAAALSPAAKPSSAQ